jgi:NADH-quinone oxidoreductase subunit J
MIAAIAFYAFAAILLVSAALVVTARNPVHSVLWLILGFFNASALFLIAGAEFLAMILVIVYVGAVAVLFLFVVMMLDVNFAELRSGYQRYLPIGATIGAILFVELMIVLGGWKLAPGAANLRLSPTPANVQNTAALGKLLYTDYIFLFQAAGLVLLVAMIGAIVLTLRDKQTSRHQVIAAQIARIPADTIELMDVGTGAGVKTLGILRPKPPEPEPAEETHGGGHHGHGGAHHGPEVR